MVSSLPGVGYGELFYRNLDIAKTEALKLNYGNFDATMSISSEIKQDFKWWVDNIGSSPKFIDRGNPSVCLLTDASKKGLGRNIR